MRVLIEMRMGLREKIASRKHSNSGRCWSMPAPLPLAVTVPEGQPVLRFTSS